MTHLIYYKLSYKIIFILLVLLFSIELEGAKTNILSLQDCIDIAVKNNYTVKKEQLSLQNSYLGLDNEENAYYPKLTLSAGAPEFKREYRYSSPGHYNFDRLNLISLKASMKNELPTGADVTVSLSGDYNKTINGRLEPESEGWGSAFDTDGNFKGGYNFSASISQPLFQRNSTAISITKTKKRLKNQELNYKQTIKDIKHTITDSYFNLLSAIRNYKIKKNTYNKSKMNYELGKKKFKTGLIPEVDALQLEVSYNQRQASLLKAEKQIIKNKESLLINMGLELDYPFNINENISFKEYKIDFKRTFENSIDKDMSLINLKYSLYAGEEDYKDIDDESGLDASVTAAYNHNIYKEPRPYYYEYDFSVGLQFEYPLIDFGLNSKRLERKKNDIETTRIRIKEHKIKFTRDFKNLVSDIEEQRKTISIYSNAARVAKKRHNISLNQFENGIITTLELLSSEADLTDSETSYLNAIISYKILISKINKDYNVIYK